MIFLEKLNKDELRKRRNADKRERYHWYVSHGICPFCLNDAQPGRVRCAVCLEKNYASHQKHDANRTEKQKSDYLQKHKLHQREKRQRLKEQGICPVCMKRPVSIGFKSCIECRTKEKQKTEREGKSYRKTLGLCAYCDEPPIPGKRCCPKHYASRIVSITKCRQSEGFRLSQIEQKKRMSVFWREMEWERNQRMKQPQWICPQPR